LEPNSHQLESLKLLRQALHERQALRDSTTGLALSFRLFMAVEVMIRELCLASGLEVRATSNFSMIQALRDAKTIPDRLVPHLDSIRMLRNMSAHAAPGFELSEADVEVVERQVLLLFKWYLVESSNGPRMTLEQASGLLEPPVNSTLAEPLKKRVFLCYAKEDHEKVEALYETLKNGGFRPWMDKKDLLPGQHWEAEIRQAIEEADFFIACMSQQSVNKRGYVQKEVQFALDVLGQIPHGQIYFIPLRLEPCDIPRPLTSLQWLDIGDSSFRDRLFRALNK
jgi:hypothetical protein